VTQLRPDNNRPPSTDSDEKATLLAFLDYQRDAVAAKAVGISDEQGRTPGVPSGTSILGLIRHLTAAERLWFEEQFDGGPAIGETDLEMAIRPEETAAGLLAAYREAIRRSNEIIAACDGMSQPSVRPARGETRTLRWTMLHVLGETTRHAGHADILREQIDGATGR
jgi:uncharacterized damage-inducible protein DinB